MISFKRKKIIVITLPVLASIIFYTIGYHFTVSNLAISSQTETEEIFNLFAELSIAFDTNFQYLVLVLISLFLLYHIYAYYNSVDSKTDVEEYKKIGSKQLEIGKERRTWKGIGNIFTVSKFLYLYLLFMILVGLAYLYVT